MYSSYIRIVCALVAMAGFHKATTPPHPPPSLDEKVPSTSLEVLLRQRLGQSIVKAICWAAAVSEIAVVVSTAHRDLWISKYLLAALAKPQCPEKIRLSPFFFLGTAMAGLGGCMRWSCYRALGKFFTFEMAIRDGHRLVTDGPYSLVRHPGYTGLLLAVTGIIIWHASPGSWARECGMLETDMGRIATFTYLILTTSIIAGLISRMTLEDAALKRVFGEQWNGWAKRVPYKLVPWIY